MDSVKAIFPTCPGVGGHRMSDATGSGTIYRIAPKDFKPQIPKLDLSTKEGQIAALLSPAVNVRSLGWQALREQGESALSSIQQVLANANPLLAARGIWLLPFAGSKGEQVRFSVYVDRSPTSESIPPIAELMNIPGNAAHGRALFFSKHLNCASCHSVAGFGGSLGPDLTQITKKHAPPVLLEGIVKPSAAIATGFETLMIVTTAGKVVNGLTVSAGDPVVLKDGPGKSHTIARSDIEEMLSSKTSMMPELKKLLTAQEVASLAAFLREMELQ